MPAASREEGRALIEALVARFGGNESHYMSAEFDETSTREQFINGLFDALGWDVLDSSALGPAREVVFHPRLREHRTAAGIDEWDEDLTAEEIADRDPITQVPDYAFRRDGTIRFFVEAKRAGARLDSRVSAFQVKSYAWSNRVRVAVLTNFRELRVFETVARPEYGNPAGGRIDGLALSYSEYPDQWDAIWNLLSKEAVDARSIEQTARQRRGALRVDEAFLAELSTWREEFARDLAERNHDLDRWELAEATQRILDRLVFLRVCEDRTLEQDVVLRRYARRTDAYRALQVEMRRLDTTYNGALFAHHFSERLELSDDVLQRFIASLYFPFSPYRFDRIGVDLLGSIYERFLGAEITLDGNRRVRVEDKPEVRHAGGVYYTPPWVVQRIVRGCLEPLLEGRTPRTAEDLRIVDPACGSGSFLLGALDYLIEWHENYYTANSKTDPKLHYAVEGTKHRRLTSDAKAAIVRRNLFGVDIDPQAVEVAQMSLYLKILEFETGASLHQHPRLFPGPYLPKLVENIRCGNSLLTPDDVPDQLLFDADLFRRLNPFDWRDADHGFGKIFDERGGFDAVIGNPPYTRVQELRRWRREEAEIYDRTYVAAEAGYDIASLFVERGLSLLRPPRNRDRGGRLGYIVTRTFCETDSAAPLRRVLSDGRHVARIIDFGAGTVFEGASAYTLLLYLTRERNGQYDLTRVPSPPGPEMLALSEADENLTASLPAATLSAEPWPLTLPAEQEILDRLGAQFPSLRDVSGDSIFQGVVTGADSVFRAKDVGPHPDDADLRLVRPFALAGDAEPIAIETGVLRSVVAGSNDLHRFREEPRTEWVILPYERPDGGSRYEAMTSTGLERRYPRAFDWLKQNESTLRARKSGTWNDETWILFSRRQNLEKFGEPKVLIPYMVRELNAVPDHGSSYFVNVTTGGYGVNVGADFDISLEYLAALLNSDLLSWVLKRRSRAWRGDWLGARNDNLARLPIAITNSEQQSEVVERYRGCVAAARATDEARSDRDKSTAKRVLAEATRRFDDLIFELYGVDDDQLRVIRSA